MYPKWPASFFCTASQFCRRGDGFCSTPQHCPAIELSVLQEQPTCSLKAIQKEIIQIQVGT